MSATWLNPVRGILLLVGTALARVGLIDRHRVVRATDLSWPRIVTGLARMSKSTADIAMVSVALGPAAVAGVGYAAPFWSLAFALAGGVAGATIGLVSQRFGAEAYEELALAVKASALVAVAITLPVAVAYLVAPSVLIDLVGSGDQAVAYGTEYLQIVGLGVPFAAVNLVASRTLVGADDAWTPMMLRGGGAVINIVINVVLIFGLDMGVTGAAIGTVVANAVIAVAFTAGLARGHLPGIGEFPVRIPLSGPHFDRGLASDLREVATPLVATNVARRSADFPKLAIVSMFGPNVVAAYVVALRVRALMDTPNWGFSLASSSLVGQALGEDDETLAGDWAQDVLRFCVAVYAVIAVSVFAFAAEITALFGVPEIAVQVTAFIQVACLSVVFNGVTGGATGPLRASGDTRWPFYAQLTGMYVVGLGVAYLGILFPVAIGVTALYASIVLEKAVPGIITYYRYHSGSWKAISRQYRPDAAAGD